MAISEIHALGSCKAVPVASSKSSSSRCYSDNRNIRSQSPQSFGRAHALLLLSMLMLMLMLSSCLALPSESTTILPSVDIEEVTTVIPPQQPAIEEFNPPQKASTVNESIVLIEPIKSTAAETVDDVVHTSFVSLGGEGLEQGIRNAVKTEVELEIEANSSGSLVDTLQAEHADNEQKATNIHVEHTDAAQGVREPKTLDTETATAEEKDVKPTHVIVENDKSSLETHSEAEAEAEAEVETEEKTEQPIEAVVNNDKSMQETTITEEKAEEPTDLEEEPKLETVTDKQEGEQEKISPPLPSVTSDLVAVIFDENRAITEQPITDTNILVLEHEHEKVALIEETPKSSIEITKHQVTKKQGVEDLLPKENAEKPVESESGTLIEPEILQEIEYTPKSTTETSLILNEIEDNVIENDEKDQKVVQEVVSSSTESEHNIEATEAFVDVVAPVEEVAEPVLVASSETPEESLTPTEASIAQEAEAEETAVEAEAKLKPLDEESIVAESESSSTAAPVESEVLKVSEESEVDSNESEQQTKQPDIDSAEKDSSEESEEVSGEEPKAKAEDSTATPLVSYPPHNAGQTFDSNLADERSAYLSLASSSRSTLIIAVCSGTAVIFIVISLVIFVLSFQRQHGTLDIEMQEQRLGKDDLDVEDAQMKLLDVDLSTPVIIAMGNEETDECL